MDDGISQSLIDAPGVVAVYDDTAQARDAIQRLQRQGVDPVHVSVIGPRLDEERARDVQRDLEHDEGRALVKEAFGGALVGGALGTAAGAIGVLAIPGLGPTLVGGALIAAASGGAAAVAGGAAGVATVSPSADGDWERTFADVGEDDVLVVVHSQDETLLQDAEVAFRDSGAKDVRRSAEGERP